MQQQLIDRDAAASLVSARRFFPAAALAYLTKEIEVLAEALGLVCVAVGLRETGTDLEATADFDLSDDDGKPYQSTFLAPMRTLH